MNSLREDIKRLSQLIGITSREKAIAHDVEETFKNSLYQIEKDALGNMTLAHPTNREGKKTVLIFAHMDEIGMIVRKVEPSGFLRFERLGGVNTQILPGLKVQVVDCKGQAHPGVIGVQAHHFMSAENKFKIPPIHELYIDMFAQSLQEVLQLGIDVGSMVALQSDFQCIQETTICGKSLDNRVAMAILYHCAQQIEKIELPYNLVFCFPVMEEFNIRGLLPVIRKIKPDVSIGLDITPACDTPDLSYNNIALGKGPAITCMNFHGGGTLAGVLPDQELFDLLVATAQRLKIPLQKEVSPGVITENAFVLFENEGIKVANLSIPTRYTHTPNETAMLSDIELLLLLLKETLTEEVSRWIGL